jgi:hypothetical protein
MPAVFDIAESDLRGRLERWLSRREGRRELMEGTKLGWSPQTPTQWGQPKPIHQQEWRGAAEANLHFLGKYLNIQPSLRKDLLL